MESPLQYSCLENPMARGAWHATVHSGAQSLTRLKRLSMRTTCTFPPSFAASELLSCVNATSSFLQYKFTVCLSYVRHLLSAGDTIPAPTELTGTKIHTQINIILANHDNCHTMRVVINPGMRLNLDQDGAQEKRFEQVMLTYPDTWRDEIICAKALRLETVQSLWLQGTESCSTALEPRVRGAGWFNMRLAR